MCASSEFFTLFRIPVAKPKATSQVDGGMLFGVGISNTDAQATGYGFVYDQLTPHVALSGVIDRENGGVGVQFSLFQFNDPRTEMTHYFGAGITNTGSLSTLRPGYPILNYYANYTGEMAGGTWIHFGLGSNRTQDPSILSFSGVEVDFEVGHGFIEWDGRLINIGYKHFLQNGLVLHAYVSPSGPIGINTVNNVVTIGFSFCEIANKQTLPKPDILAVPIKEEPIIKKVETATVEDAVRRLNLSSKYFSQGNYEMARDELEKIKDIFPTADTYSRLGSVYYKLNDMPNAYLNWEKSITIDPKNTSLREFVDQIKVKAKK